jgi:hypothetical protein
MLKFAIFVSSIINAVYCGAGANTQLVVQHKREVVENYVSHYNYQRIDLRLWHDNAPMNIHCRIGDNDIIEHQLNDAFTYSKNLNSVSVQKVNVPNVKKSNVAILLKGDARCNFTIGNFKLNSFDVGLNMDKAVLVSPLEIRYINRTAKCLRNDNENIRLSCSLSINDSATIDIHDIIQIQYNALPPAVTIRESVPPIIIRESAPPIIISESAPPAPPAIIKTTKRPEPKPRKNSNRLHKKEFTKMPPTNDSTIVNKFFIRNIIEFENPKSSGCILISAPLMAFFLAIAQCL